MAPELILVVRRDVGPGVQGAGQGHQFAIDRLARLSDVTRGYEDTVHKRREPVEATRLRAQSEINPSEHTGIGELNRKRRTVWSAQKSAGNYL